MPSLVGHVSGLVLWLGASNTTPGVDLLSYGSFETPMCRAGDCALNLKSLNLQPSTLM